MSFWFVVAAFWGVYTLHSIHRDCIDLGGSPFAPFTGFWGEGMAKCSATLRFVAYY